MDSNDILKSIRPSLEVNKDLKIKELELELHHKTIKLNQYIKEAAKKKKVTTPKQIKEEKSKKQKKNEAYLEANKKAKDKWKELFQKKFLECQFLAKRVKEKYGAAAYLDLLNSMDNPNGLPDAKNFKDMHGITQ